MPIPTPKLDEAIKRLGKTPPVRRGTGRIPKKQLHLEHYEGVVLQAPILKALLLAERDLKSHGHPGIIVISSYRSWAKQAMLYAAWLARGRTGLPAAPPGSSEHNYGRAIDISNDEDRHVRAALNRHGFVRGTAFNDPVHFEH